MPASSYKLALFGALPIAALAIAGAHLARASHARGYELGYRTAACKYCEGPISGPGMVELHQGAGRLRQPPGHKDPVLQWPMSQLRGRHGDAARAHPLIWPQRAIAGVRGGFKVIISAACHRVALAMPMWVPWAATRSLRAAHVAPRENLVGQTSTPSFAGERGRVSG
jgi:hypothetical protein